MTLPTLPSICVLCFVAVIACKKSDTDADVPARETLTQVPDSVTLSYAEAGSWKVAYSYALAYKEFDHYGEQVRQYSVKQVDYTPAPLPLLMTEKIYNFNGPQQRGPKIFLKQYVLHAINTGYVTVPGLSTVIDAVQGMEDLAPMEISVHNYEDVDGNYPFKEEYFLVKHTEPRLSLPFDITTTTSIPVLPYRDKMTDFIVQYREDSLLRIEGDLDLKASYFEPFAPDNDRYSHIYVNNFILTNDSVCAEYTFDKIFREASHISEGPYYIYDSVGRKKMNFKYDEYSRALSVIFNAMDPAWFYPYRNMLDDYYYNNGPKTSMRTFFENISSSYTDSLFFYSSGNRVLYSATHVQNNITTDHKNRIISLIKQSSAGQDQDVKYQFYYKD